MHSVICCLVYDNIKSTLDKSFNMAASQPDDAEGNLLRPRPMRALPEALRAAGNNGLNGFAEAASSISR
jgi:hypothetical protein